MDNKKNKGYILFINLILITLIGFFIPLLIQQQKLNYKILNNRITAAQKMEAVESGLQYQLYFLKQENLLLDERINFNKDIELILKGREDDKFIYLTVSLSDGTAYNAQMKLEKESRTIIKKKIYRSE